MGTKQLEVDISYTYQDTRLNLEIRTEGELEQFMEALQKDENTVVELHNHKHNIALDVYLRFRE